jgi:hypothetical protein
VIRFKNKSPYYFGSGATYRRSLDKEDNGFDLKTQIFGGTRNLAETGVMVDLELKSDKTNQGGKFPIEYKSAQLGLYKNDLFQTPLYTGLEYSYGRVGFPSYTEDLGADPENPDTNIITRHDGNSYLVDVFKAKLGVQLSLFDLNVLYSKSEKHSIHISNYDNEYTSSYYYRDLYIPQEMLAGEVRYSEKSRLAAAEPGVEARVSIHKLTTQRFTFYDGNLSYTKMFYGTHAITPSVYGLMYDSNECTYTETDDEILHHCTSKQFDFQEISLNHQYIFNANWILGAEAGQITSDGDSQSFNKNGHAALSASYISNSLVMKLAFMVGRKLDDQFGIDQIGLQNRGQK